jgi:hypothetical protein
LKTRLKTCEGCNHQKPLWNSRLRLCRDCFYRLNPIELKPRKKIQAVSEKRKKELVLYRTERDIYMAHHKTCEAKLVGCTVKAKALHHTQGRTKNLRNQETWKALCDHCHRFIHEQMSMDEAVFLGLMQYRN